MMYKECEGCRSANECSTAVQPGSIMCQMKRMQNGQTKADFETCKSKVQGRPYYRRLINCNDDEESGIEDPDKLTIKVKYFGDVQKVEKISAGNWIDLRCAEDVEMKAGEYKMFPLGVAMELPKGYEAIVAPRSSTFRKYGIILVNSIGIIDESYCGDNDQWQYLAYAMMDTKIPKNERICQFRIIKHQPEVEFVEVETLGNEDRGGIGSTGRI